MKCTQSRLTDSKRNQTAVMKSEIIFKYFPIYDYSKEATNNCLDGIFDFLDGNAKYTAPHDFNDPFECSSPFGSSLRVINRSGDDAHHTSQSERMNRVGIFCASKTKAQPLMWAHYASKHTGIVIGFKRTDIFKYAENVHYKNIREFIEHADLCSYELARKVFLTKHDVWRYENEVRDISIEATQSFKENLLERIQYEDDYDRASTMMLKPYGPGKYNFDKKIITSINFGARCSYNNQQGICEHIRYLGLNLTLKRAFIHPHNYSLSFKTIMPDNINIHCK